jgi:hypothetical protein
MQDKHSGSQTSGRRQLALILIISTVSLGGSYLLFFAAQNGSGWGTTNNGDFVMPPTTIADVGWQDENGLSVTTSGNWWLWTVANNCLEDCAKALKNLQATHILLNREAKRVKRGVSISSGSFVPEGQPDLKFITTSKKPVSPGIYIVDPNGNLVFRYPVTTNPKEILQDLKKLLKVSQIG